MLKILPIVVLGGVTTILVSSAEEKDTFPNHQNH